MLRSSAFRKGLGWTMGAILVFSLVFWYVTRERLPSTIRIASAYKGGLYHKFGTILGHEIKQGTEVDVEVLETRGSVENLKLLLSGEADLAIIQAGAVDTEGLALLAPLYHEVVHVIVRKASGIGSIQDLVGKNVALGPEGSGMRQTAIQILQHYRIQLADLGPHEGYYTDLPGNPKLDAAIATTGFLNDELKEIMRGGDFEILSIQDAAAISIHHYFFRPITIPRGMYGERPPAPPEPVQTVASTSFLVGRPGISALLIKKTLDSLYESDLQRAIPTLLPPNEAAQSSLLRLHPEARSYHDPYGGIGLLANFMESITAIKELLFALGAGMYLLWDRWRRLKEREQMALFKTQKENLDKLLNRTVKIERAQMDTSDPAQLKNYLDEVTLIKLEALEELTHEELRGDQLFSIFLAQCANLIRKIQTKIELASKFDGPA